MERVLANKVVWRGETYALSVAEISDDGHTARVFPFEREIEGTSYVCGTIYLLKGDDGLWHISQAKALAHNK